MTSHQRESVPPASEPPTSPISKSVSQKIPVPPSAIPVRVSDLASSEFSHDSSSIAEDDEESDIDRRQVSSNVLENEIGTDKTINLLKDINAEIEGAGYEADLSEAAKNEEKKSMEFHKPLLFLLHLYRHLHRHIILILIIHQMKQKFLKLILNRKSRIHQFQVVLLQFLSPFLLLSCSCSCSYFSSGSSSSYSRIQCICSIPK